jgi:hypothetical protein
LTGVGTPWTSMPPNPIGVLKAQCGHLLLMVTELDPEPLGSRCKSYAAMQPAGARRVTSASVSR